MEKPAVSNEPRADSDESTPADRRARRIALAKTISWRFIASFTTFVIAWALTGELSVGLAVGGIEAVAKMFLYYFHERVWYRATGV